MKSRLKRFWLNLKKAANGVKLVFSRPKYVLLAALLAFLISTLIYFSINFNFYASLLGSGLPILDKFGVIWLLISSMFGSYFADLFGALLLGLSILQGIALALLIYNLKTNKKIDAKTATGSGVATAAAIVGLGCVSCGTSLLIPIMTLIFSSSAYAFLDAANTIVLILASVLSLYAIYKMGLMIHINHVTKSWMKEGKNEKSK